ncbi:MAG: hypothetical protein QG642_202 [Patescibacteria group bacterium]|nr:hypothetical protein [Patescibacteria group bacterium]
MDDKKINLLPDHLRFKEDKAKRPTLGFNPDFKKPGKKEKSHEYKQSGGQVSVWSKIFQRKQKPTNTAPVAPRAFTSNISYNNEDKNTVAPKIAPITMHVPDKMAVKVEEHIQDFVPAQAKNAKPKGPSFWSKFAKKPKATPAKTTSSALTNGLKYNGNGNASASDAIHQPEGKLDITVFQELNKQAEQTDYLKAKKISDQVSAVVKAEKVVEPAPVTKAVPAVELVPAKIKDSKPQGPSWWSKFLALFKRTPKSPMMSASALSNGLKYNGNGATTETKAQPDLKTFRELNKQAEETYNFDLTKVKKDNQVLEEQKKDISFDLNKAINEEINLVPLEDMGAKPESAPVEVPKIDNGFSMPEYAPKAKLEPVPMSTEISVDNPHPRVTGPQFHMPEAGQKNSLLNGGVDLVPIAARVRSWKQILTLFSFALILSFVILGSIYGYVMFEKQRIITEQNRQKAEIAKIEAKILDFTALNKDISNLGQEIKLVQDALNRHVYWTNFFALLEKYTVSDVYYSGLAVGTNGGLTLSATTKSYDSVAKQLKVLNSAEAKEFVQAASIMSASRAKEQDVSFQIIITLNSDLFYWSGQ